MSGHHSSGEPPNIFRLVVGLFLFLVLVLAGVVVALIRVEHANSRQDQIDHEVQVNTARIERVQYANCIALREQHLRQNALIDRSIAEREARPDQTALDRKAIEQLKQFRFDVPRCGPKPS